MKKANVILESKVQERIGFTIGELMEFVCDSYHTRRSNKVENTNSDYLNVNNFNKWMRLKRIKKLINGCI